MSGRRLWVAAGVVVLLDQLTKAWALGALENGRTVDVVWTLRFALGFNSGFAFGTGQGWGVAIGFVAFGVIVYLIRSMSKVRSTVLALALALIAGGAAGNVVDRLFRNGGWMRGKVVDFIDLQWWPVFNIADSAISVGAVLMVIGTFLEWRHESERARQTADRP